MRDGRMLYEDLVVNEGENKIIHETCYKSSHKGEIIVQAKIKDKYKAKSKAYNLVKIAREVCRTGIRIRGIKSCRFEIADLRFANIIEANKCLNLGRGKEEYQVEYSIPRRVTRIKGVISD